MKILKIEIPQQDIDTLHDIVLNVLNIDIKTPDFYNSLFRVFPNELQGEAIKWGIAGDTPTRDDIYEWLTENKNSLQPLIELETGKQTIDLVAERIASVWIDLKAQEVEETFYKIFKNFNDELIKHLLNKWANYRGDFAPFYINADDRIRRAIFEYYKIELDEHKFAPDDIEGEIKSLISENYIFDRLPFQSAIIHQFYLMALNYSLEYLDEITNGTEKSLIANKIDMYGNGINWAKAWTILTDEQKTDVVRHLLITKF